MELDRVAAPVLIEHAVELRQQQREDLRRRQRVAGRKLPAGIGATFGPRREGDVLEERHHLQCRDATTHRHRHRREAQCLPRIQTGRTLRVEKREVDRPQPEREQQKVRHVVVAQHDERDHERKGPVAPRFPMANRVQQRPERQGRERRHEQLAVMPRTHLRGHDARELVRHTRNHTRVPREPERPTEAIGEPSGQHEVDRHAERDRHIHRHDPS